MIDNHVCILNSTENFKLEDVGRGKSLDEELHMLIEGQPGAMTTDEFTKAWIKYDVVKMFNLLFGAPIAEIMWNAIKEESNKWSLETWQGIISTLQKKYFQSEIK